MPFDPSKFGTPVAKKFPKKPVDAAAPAAGTAGATAPASATPASAVPAATDADAKKGKSFRFPTQSLTRRILSITLSMNEENRIIFLVFFKSYSKRCAKRNSSSNVFITSWAFS